MVPWVMASMELFACTGNSTLPVEGWPVSGTISLEIVMAVGALMRDAVRRCPRRKI